jgi:hypothetical protein
MTTYTLKPEVVRECLHTLIDESIHRMYPGYLCLHQQSAIEGRLTGLSFPYNEFFDDYLRVTGDESDKPYFVPFSSDNTSLEDLWLNYNVSGTYAPSSLRSTAPLMKIAEIEKGGHNSEWGLVDGHWRVARLELCDGNRIPAESLAAYLLRDYAFKVEEQPSAYTLANTFAEEFGYELGGKAFSHLYQTGDSDISEESFDKYD